MELADLTQPCSFISKPWSSCCSNYEGRHCTKQGVVLRAEGEKSTRDSHILRSGSQKSHNQDHTQLPIPVHDLCYLLLVLPSGAEASGKFPTVSRRMEKSHTCQRAAFTMFVHSPRFKGGRKRNMQLYHQNCFRGFSETALG